MLWYGSKRQLLIHESWYRMLSVLLIKIKIWKIEELVEYGFPDIWSLTALPEDIENEILHFSMRIIFSLCFLGSTRYIEKYGRRYFEYLSKSLDLLSLQLSISCLYLRECRARYADHLREFLLWDIRISTEFFDCFMDHRVYGYMINPL